MGCEAHLTNHWGIPNTEHKGSHGWFLHSSAAKSFHTCKDSVEICGVRDFDEWEANHLQWNKSRGPVHLFWLCLFQFLEVIDSLEITTKWVASHVLFHTCLALAGVSGCGFGLLFRNPRVVQSSGQIPMSWSSFTKEPGSGVTNGYGKRHSIFQNVSDMLV